MAGLITSAGSGRRRRQLTGTAGLLLAVMVIALVIMTYDRVFSPGLSATVLAPRAGLLMEAGADVTLDGVTVGRVTSISPAGDGQARLDISLDPGQVSYIPANVRASIEAPSVFGPKFLNLLRPAHPSAQHLQAGQVIEPAQVPTEIDTVFASLVSVLNSVHPAQLAAALGAVSTALHGRGAALGHFIGQLNSYLREFNPSLPGLGRDLSVAPTAAGAYAAAAPDLIQTLGNLRVTSGTLVSEQARFDAFLIDLSGLAGNTRRFLAGNSGAIARTLATLLPTTRLLGYYSPEFSCLLAGTRQVSRQFAATENIILEISMEPGADPYRNPANLPVVGAASGPSCYGGPLTAAETQKWGRVTFDDGTAGIFSHDEALTPGNPPLAVRLFGPSAAAVLKGR